MNIVVMGAGAVGGYFGGRLAQVGHRVTLVARGAHLEALRAGGLRLRSTLGDAHLEHLAAVEDPRDAAPDGDAVDLVLFTVKAQDSAGAADRIAPLVTADTRVLTLQNGVDGVDVLRRRFDDAQVLAGVAYIEALIAEPGAIVHKSPFARIVFGPLEPGDLRAEEVARAFRDAGVETTLEADPMVAVWRKWLLICAFSGLTALTRKPIGRVVERPETRALLRRAMEEIAALAAARGVALPADAVEGAMTFVSETAAPTMTSSLAQDLAAGKRLELEALNGAASRMGRELDVATPVNDFIYAALVLHGEGAA
jgi:2-dehydropantoate 2-reductase